MPYISKSRRDAIFNDSLVDKDDRLLNAGELNYMFTFIINEYIRNHGLSYSKINDVLGALEGAKLEFVRRKVASYENKKKKENGDVYD